MIDYVCRYAPIELIAGFGEQCRYYNLPVEHFAGSDRLIHRNVCSFSRSLLEKRSGINVGPLLLTDCCNSIRRAGDVLSAQGQRVFMLNLPHNDDSCAKKLYANELMKLMLDYGAYSGRTFDAGAFSAACKNAAGKAAGSVEGPYIAVMGARMSDELLWKIQGESLLPLRNVTCTGLRSIGVPPETTDAAALLEWYAGELLSQIPCMRMADVSSRRRLVLDPNLKAIVYNTVSFCDFYGFEFAGLRREISVPILKLETDYTPQSAAELRTRVEAFFESIDNLRGIATGQNSAGKREKRAAGRSVASGCRQDVPSATASIAESRSTDRYFTAGIDSGSTSTNAVIMDSHRNIMASATVLTGTRVGESAQRAFHEALVKADLSPAEIRHIVTTGYGRRNTGFAADVVTEITCHAKGAFFLNGKVRTVVDIGGQDSKVIRLDRHGVVKDFAMNDKCAAGTGRFLEMMAQSLGISIEEMSLCGKTWNEGITISSMCSVFAQSEVVSLIAEGKKLEDIVHGLDLSIASKVIALGGRAPLERECMMTGGVANNSGVVEAMEQKLGCQVLVPDQPELCGALGAALLALEAH
ncbi:MAG: acyl-CoA dehydratase activase [Spirochaetaceae bacterium]|nr:acyl-CoA dehydratase activase [Spirochaetaceae bacterium]